jgi:hypothetical protein
MYLLTHNQHALRGLFALRLLLAMAVGGVARMCEAAKELDALGYRQRHYGIADAALQQQQKRPSSVEHWIEQACVSRCSAMYGPLVVDVLVVWACLQLMGIADFRAVGLASREGAKVVKYHRQFKKTNYRSRGIEVPDPWQPAATISGADFVDRLGHFLEDRTRCKQQLRNVKPLTSGDGGVPVSRLVKRFKQLINIVLDCPFIGNNGAVCPDVLQYRGALLQRFAAEKRLQLSSGEREWLAPLVPSLAGGVAAEVAVWEAAGATD